MDNGDHSNAGGPGEEVLRRYVQRRASPEEEERVELALMTDARLLDAVMTDQVLAEGLAHAVAEPGGRVVAGSAVAESRTVNWAIAAALIMGVGAAVSGIGWINASRALARLEASAAADRMIGQVSVVLLASERGAGNTVRVPKGDPSVPVLFELPLDPPYAARYRLELTSPGGTAPDYAVDRLTIQAGGMLAALVPRTHLRAGGHALRVLAEDGEGAREMMQVEVLAD
jgi:hypothetical protein